MYKREFTIGGKTLSIETGKLAKQADGSAIVRYGDTVVIVTACCANTEREGIDFLPLTVDYREYAYASGRIPGGFFKREARPSEKETLTSRVIDRPIRPLFPAGWRRETQVIAFVLSSDGEHDADVLALTGASAALSFSRIPFQKTIAAVRVGLVNDEIVINPTYTQRAESRLDLVVAGSRDALVMVEAGSLEVSEEQIVQALEAGHEAIRQLVEQIDAMAGEIAKPKLAAAPASVAADVQQEVERQALEPLTEAMRIKDKIENYKRVDRVQADLLASIPEEDKDKRAAAKRIFKALSEQVLRNEILERNTRLDGRAFDEIRSIWTEVGTLPRTHGSAVFTRGETQALVTVTLGTADDQQKIESLAGESYRRFMLHYNFPPFSVGEVKFLRGPGRREIGHGALAERALSPTIPDEDKFPYTIRVVSDILESNGSSSMATVCGASLSLMDAGVPLKSPVAGVAMGLIMDESTGRHAILSDIAGAEDHYGDMDFKVAGTVDGITALQMDIKVTGITMDIMRKALEQARAGRLHILQKMTETIGSPREDVSTFAPRIVTIRIPVDKIRDVIGPGGKMIRSIIDRTGVKIDVENDGRVNVASTDEKSAQKAIDIIQELTASPELHKTYLGKVQRITDFGAFVEIMPNVDGLLHVSEIALHRVKDVRDELKDGEQVRVKVINIDPSGKVRLSRKALLQEAGDSDGAATPGK
ncbi:MAG: polyribonucleotide nucleotidyltransferase [Vicinamibacterales bacterium]|jgi:polyribonucleotide nucleotidyltransferase|nr:polyribonucleotide nucleotidyltransferase [Acidobacteriota bacterium]MDP7470813.1 polyribonucleotide nucleotidyltransferase [Vicinamibacterales bacterium]MDP7672891.1 polyribonucleotide nucleotidyltransferase [Vicinamibacterales bacterium]HJO37407.1 polyribonucleotide nucleotidyltransferase [Vicinamibacterales bacterium]|tara:strand:+ start:686 stop:2803 length:2118 start_codon:yes stop_codon:yes gene_type:complete